ncbi:MAG: NAD kinase [Alphaproteobacteria bacterium]
MKIFYEVSNTPEAKKEFERLNKLFPASSETDAEVIVVIGGDGFMLRSLHKYYGKNKKMYGLNFGTVGFMMNPATDDLLSAIEKSNEHIITPLELTATLKDGKTENLMGFNEVSIHRKTAQAINLKVQVGNKTRLDELICDGALVSTPAGSTAYNLSANGSILPLDSNAISLTPISSFRPRRWRGAILPNTVDVIFESTDTEKRPAYATADNKTIDNVVKMKIKSAEKGICILTDANHDLEERIISEQFN